MILLIKMLLAHLLGDFWFQRTSWVNDKEQKKWQSWFLYLHIVIHFALIMVITADLSFWMQAMEKTLKLTPSAN